MRGVQSPAIKVVGMREVHETLIDRTGLSCGPMGPRAVVLERDVMRPYHYPVALVGSRDDGDAMILTEDQTAQALRQ